MLKPKSYGACGCHHARTVGSDLERHLVEVVGHGHILGVILGRRIFYTLALAHLAKCHARDDVYRLARSLTLQCLLQCVPDATIKCILYLWHRVGYVECLLLHTRYTVARAIWYEVPSRVVVVVAVRAEVHLV